MRIKQLLFLTTGLFLSVTMGSNAQTYGTWVGANDTPNPAYFWEYNPVGVANTFNSGASNQESISTTGTPGFLPIPPSGTARVFTPSGSIGGGFALSASSLTATSTNAGSPVKFSSYGIGGASQVSSLFFDIDFNSTTAGNGIIILAFGKHTNGQIFNNTNQIGGSNTAGIFGALRLEFYGGSNIQTYYRTTAFANNANANLTIFSRTAGSQHVEIYCNNSNITRSYIRESVTYNLPAQTYNVYIAGTAFVPVGLGSANIPATGELAADEIIDAFVLNAASNSGATANTLNYSINNIKIGRVAQSVLPVTFTSFTGSKKASSVLLNWSTASELRNNTFDILSSCNGTDFKVLGSVRGGGTSNEVKNYSFTDFNPASGITYYKLKQTDFDGKSSFYDKTLAFDFGMRNVPLTAFVNAENKLVLTCNTDKKDILTVTVTDLSGKTIINKKINTEAGINQLSIDISFATPGLYVATITDATKVSTTKFLKK